MPQLNIMFDFTDQRMKNLFKPDSTIDTLVHLLRENKIGEEEGPFLDITGSARINPHISPPDAWKVGIQIEITEILDLFTYESDQRKLARLIQNHNMKGMQIFRFDASMEFYTYASFEDFFKNETIPDPEPEKIPQPKCSIM